MTNRANLELLKSDFNEQLMASYSPILELKSNYGVSFLRDQTSTTNSGSVTNDGSEYVLSTGTTANSTAQLRSAGRGRYLPGQECLPGIGVRTSTVPTSDQEIRFGYFDNNNGFGAGINATGIFTFIKVDGTITRTYQQDWRVDRLDGSRKYRNPSGVELDFSDGLILRMPFVWYGYGRVKFFFLVRDADGNSRYLNAHFTNPVGLSVKEPNLPVNAEVDNGSTTDDVELRVGGRQFAVLGNYVPLARRSYEERLSVGSIGTTRVPLLAIRKKSTFNSVQVTLSGFQGIANANMIYEVFGGGTTSGGSGYGDLTDTSPTETSLESLTDLTGYTRGELLTKGFVTSGQGRSVGVPSRTDELGLDIPEGEPIIYTARTISGTGTGSVIANLREEW